MKDLHKQPGRSHLHHCGSVTDAVPIGAQHGDRPSRTDIGSVPTEVYLPKQAMGQIWLIAHSVLTLLYSCFAMPLSSLTDGR